MQHQDNNKISSSLEATLAKARENAKSKGLFLTDDDIEAYARGDLDNETTAILEMRMAQDLEFAAEVNTEMALADGIRQYAKVHHVEMSGSNETPKAAEVSSMTVSASNVRATTNAPMAVRVNNWRKWLVAASIALLCGVFWLIQPETVDTDALVQKELNSFNRFAASRGYSETPYDSASTLLGNGKYEEARQIVNGTMEKTPEMLYILGMTYLYEKNCQKALEYFEPIMNDQKTIEEWRAKSLYAASLCYFSLNQKNKAREVLESLLEYLKPKDPKNAPFIQEYRDKASDLLTKF